ncbi:hypothetical protein [Bradyrhizobium ivorense]|uniref:hypothetical protein n=1 Tax=Bradyrhizobium ivorense TaxID=2511166 RepID=UPI0010B6B5F6|nr:hypothetical protein [Bradyrhizobium ivorense]VIO77389.1 hypothetical protein CI41S_56440 [Bradyrhizobium ivorense]
MTTQDRFNFKADSDDGPRGLLRLFRAAMELGENKIGVAPDPDFSNETVYSPSSYQTEPIGLVGRLQALLQAQGNYQPRRPGMDPGRYELAQAITRASRNLGIAPRDLATAISYETGGTFNHNLWGGGGGNYFGLIQFGPNEQAKYGVREGQSVTEQMQAVERFLRDRRLKAGSGLLDIYSTINAGSPGRYDRTDAGNGGAPGTVADKVNTQMGGHMAKAARLLQQYEAARPAYSVPPPFPQSADPIPPTGRATPPTPSSIGRRADDPSLPISSGAGVNLASQEDPARQSLLGLVSGTPMQFLPFPIFDPRQ